MTGLWYSPLHVTELCGEMQGNFKVGCARLIKCKICLGFLNLIRFSSQNLLETTELTRALIYACFCSDKQALLKLRLIIAI